MRTIMFMLSLLIVSPASFACRHLLFGSPGYADFQQCRLGYAVGYDYALKSAKYVAYLLDGSSVDAAERDGMAMSEDTSIEKPYRTYPEDYENSGYHMGHLANAESIDFNEAAMLETFLLSNIVPQNETNNLGIWKGLENRERAWAKERGILLVMTGPIYDKDTLYIGRSRVPVPSQLWKIIYDPDQRKAISYLIDNKPLYTRDLDKYLVSVDDIEKVTGLDFFSAVTLNQQDQIERESQPRQW